jgi:hypothetical protein
MESGFLDSDGQMRIRKTGFPRPGGSVFWGLFSQSDIAIDAVTFPPRAHKLRCNPALSRFDRAEANYDSRSDSVCVSGTSGACGQSVVA